MTGMTTNVEAREHARHRTGEFGVQAHSDPEVIVGSAVPNPGPIIVRAAATVRHVVEPARKGWFRTHPEVVEHVELTHTFRRPTRSVRGERGERIVAGMAHLPLTIDGARVPADDAHLSDLVRQVAEAAPPTSGIGDRRSELTAYVRERLRATAIIDDEVWVRGSRVRDLVPPRT